MSERGKIRSRRVTGNCTQHQRDVQVAIKTAREVALLPYVQRTASERGPGRPRPAPGREDAVEVEVEDGVGPEEAIAYDIDADLGPELAETEA
jgi:hypothetical protein